MSILPRTLLGRTIIIIVVVMLITQVLANYLFRELYIERHVRQSMSLLGENLRNIHNALLSLPPAERENFLRRIATHKRLFFHSKEQGELRFPSMTSGQQLSQQLSNIMAVPPGKKIDIRVQRSGIPTLWVRMHAEGQSFWVGVPYRNFQHTIPVAWLMWLITGLILAIVGSIWLVRRINKPLARLTEAAAEIGSGKQPEKIDESGPREIQQLSRAFNKMAEDIRTLTSNRVLLLAGVSHDLRTPLARLRLAIEMLDSHNCDDYKTEMITDIEDMDNIIDQFLMYVRHGSGEPFTSGNLNELLQSVAERYRKQGVNIMLNLADIPVCDFKPISMRRLLINLVSNAYKYAGDDIELLSYQHEDSIVVEVLDRGPGIPPEDVERLMRPFTQASPEHKTTGGTGLGLAIVKRIVAVHQGRFELLPRSGGGLAVKIKIPINQSIR